MSNLQGPVYFVKMSMLGYEFAAAFCSVPSLDEVLFAMLRILSSENDIYQAFHGTYSCVAGEKKYAPLFPRTYHFDGGLDVEVKSVPLIGAI